MFRVVCIGLLGITLVAGIAADSAPQRPAEDTVAARYYLRNRTNNFYQRSRGGQGVRHHRTAMESAAPNHIGIMIG